ncbi:hypothetical protein BO83DRAFT_430623 [Aspergillus eucalypticola CBS 122712]|uniref:Uncharacterized protein n=1 Tax=Aspergillus eucalypticola (strain CBS 122712 / IBT 29274) TaxID=1448314 RepID=A0A317UXA1_ASPEC|nr:uncharacterized protein BO83DRAFT_430623 [Aspergillus eucalypticola CBS 122712]PWY65122.1 hypothetical protein BO83DRAFT_430623 [Aspergillus eucalypticola CBS 122712]
MALSVLPPSSRKRLFFCFNYIAKMGFERPAMNRVSLSRMLIADIVHSVSDLVDFKLWLRQQAQDAIHHNDRSKLASGPVFAALLSGNGLTEEKLLERLEDESFVLIVAGDSNSQTMWHSSHLLKNKQLMQSQPDHTWTEP